MTPAEHVAILGPEFVAEMRRRAKAAPKPTAEHLAGLRPILAPAMDRVLARAARADAPPAAA
jgi:hypothetical protein